MRSTQRKTSRSRVENQQQTQPTYDARSGNRTWDTLVVGRRSHHCAIPAPHLPLSSLQQLHWKMFKIILRPFVYVKGTTQPIKWVLNNYIIKVALKTHQTFGSSFPKPKDPFPKHQVCGVICPIPCEDCGKQQIGKTKQKFNIQLPENTKIHSNKNIPRNPHSLNIVYNLVKLIS